jgi:HK97 family phage major capsid protein
MATLIDELKSQVVEPLVKRMDATDKKLAEIEKKASTPQFNPSAVFANAQPYATSGPLGLASQPYSIMKMAALCRGYLSPEQCKLEVGISNRIKEWLGSSMYGAGGCGYHQQAFLMPVSMQFLPPAETTAQESLVKEIYGHCVKGWQGIQVDPDEADAVDQRVGGQYYKRRFSKALGSISDSAGGVLVGFPTLGELIELQRNLEVFPLAGAQEVALPPNGRIQYPKQTTGSTANWIGEATAITESQPSTGYLDLIAKKLGVFVKLNNELLRFTSPTTEGLIRMDMALQAALKADLAMLEGTGGTQIKGLITYQTQSSWTQGNDSLIAYTVTGNKFQPNDAGLMEANMPDQAGEPTAWLMRRNMWSVIRNRRADSVTTGDAAGLFVFSLIREAREGIPLEFEGIRVVRSSQISNTRGGTTNTYVILGNFRDWLIGRFGIMEFLPTALGDTAFQNDQTWVRGIQNIDAGARHPASFVFADNIQIA